MKISLVVASGVHQGKAIPVPGAKFVIGRDPDCQLRPASQAVSKHHCAIITRDGRVYIQDFGSTNGTFVNDAQLEANSEVELKSGERLRVGPLDFSVQFTAGSDSTPLPEVLKSVGGSKADGLKAAAGVKPGSGTASKPVVVPAPKPQPIPKADEADAAAAMLLGMDDDDPASPPYVPDGSTVFEMPAAGGAAAKPEEKKDPKKVISREDSSNAASEILRKYMRRPK
jgi:predicted component of type VI protein secretion system